MQPDLRQLRAFLAVADQGSANRAGVALFRARSAVSRSIHKLEDELGVKLFERRARTALEAGAGGNPPRGFRHRGPAKILIEEIVRRCPEVLAALDGSTVEPASLGGE